MVYLDKLCYEFVCDYGVILVCLNYCGYIKIICILINYVVCYGILNDKFLCEGDIVNIDVMVIVDEWYGDYSCMYLIGEIKWKVECFIDIIYECMMCGIVVVKLNVIIGNIGVEI